MSNAPKKKEETNVSGIFSIPANPFEDGEIPGVTQLLNRKALGEKAEPPKKIASLEPTRTNLKTLPKAAPPSSSSSGTKTNIVAPSTLKLKDFGVLFELRFYTEGHVFRFSGAQGHKEPRLLPWQEKLFNQMKMDKKSVPAKEPFQEFRADENPFLFDAFGIQSHHVIQIVSPEYTNSRIVLVSDKSVSEHLAAILEHYSKG